MSLREAYLATLAEVERLRTSEAAAADAYRATDAGSDAEAEACGRADGYTVALAHAEAARIALHESSEHERWTARDGESGVEEDLGVCSLKKARRLAEEWQRGGDYGDVTETIWTDVYLTSETGHKETITVEIEPEEPGCDGESHEWSDDVDLVGGIKENPGVWGHGGGVTIDECCTRCGCRRHTDTWAQRRDTGEQGLTSVSYEPGYYSEALAERSAS